MTLDGIHDMGGMVGFGPVRVEPREPVFHEDWEGLAFALNAIAIAFLQAYNADEYRHAVERIEPQRYLAASYYERMLLGATALLLEKGHLSRAVLEERAGGALPVALPAQPADVRYEACPTPSAAVFAVGDRVRVSDRPTGGHTRCPRYARGRNGVVERVNAVAELPELRAHSSAVRREHTYGVRFAAQELWVDGDPTQSVIVELFETYLEVVS